MNNKVKYLMWVIIIIAFAALVYLVVSQNSKINKLEQDKAAAIANSTPISEEDKAILAAVARNSAVKEIKVEFMTDAEKLKMSIPADLKIQVLERDKTGKITTYRVIKQDSDIMTKYGN